MRKIKITLIALFMVMSFATLALSENPVTTTTGGEELNIGSSGSRILDFTPSPSTVMSVYTEKTVYTIIGASAKTTEDNGIEYGAVYDTNSMYQREQEADNICDAAEALLPSDFKNKAGTSPPVAAE